MRLPVLMELIAPVNDWGVMYHLPALPVMVKDPYAVVIVFVVVPSSKVSAPLVLIVIVLTPDAPVLSLRVSVRPGIVVVSGSVTVPGRTRESRSISVVAVETDIGLYSGVRRNGVCY